MLIPGNHHKPSNSKTHLQLFEHYIIHENWKHTYISGQSRWICEKDNLYQIHEEMESLPFSTEWTRIYPHREGSWKRFVNLVYNNTPIEQLILISCDGDHVSFILPNHELLNPCSQFPDGRIIWFWSRNSLPYKLSLLIGNVDHWGSLENIANRSKIQIRP